MGSRTLGGVSSDRVIVIGAGLTGLAVAARLVAAGRDVLVLEASRRPGGQVHTWREGGVTVELGAEGFVARSRAVPALCELLGIESQLIDQLTTDTYDIVDGSFVLLPPGEAARRLGFQVPPEELGRGIRSLARGMGQLTDALMTRVTPARIRTGVVVASISSELQVQLTDGSAEAPGPIVLATPARRAASLLAPFELAETSPLSQAPLMSNVSVNLLYRAEQFEEYPPGSGLLFPASFASVGLRALSLVDHKFAGRVPASHHLLRVFFRPVGDALTTFTDERFRAEAARAVQQVLRVSGAPERTWVSRWADALPVFSPSYKEQAAAADLALQARGIHVAGSAFHGAGIDGAVASAEMIAARLLPS